MSEAELKSVIGNLVNKIVDVVKIEMTKKDVNETVTKFYRMGHDEVELQFNLNIQEDSKELQFLKEYVFENIKSFAEETKEKLRKEISMGLLNNENVSQLTKRVKDALELSQERARMIVRTETNRAFNIGRQRAAENSGLKLKKKWVAAIDERTSTICKHLNGQTIALDRKFTYDGKEFDTSPAHPSCRSRVVYIPV